MSDDLGWNGDAVVTGAQAWDQVRRNITTYVTQFQANRGTEMLYSGELLSTDELSISVIKQVTQQEQQIGEFNGLVASLVGLNGDAVGNVHGLHGDVEGSAGDLGQAWGPGGKH